jgi:hypothetical protein
MASYSHRQRRFDHHNMLHVKLSRFLAFPVQAQLSGGVVATGVVRPPTTLARGIGLEFLDYVPTASKAISADFLQVSCLCASKCMCERTGQHHSCSLPSIV